jgi:hypothetical protein
VANANRQVNSKHSISTAAWGWVTAGLLLSLGAALQFGELGNGPYQPMNRWLFSMIADAIWRMLTLLDGVMLQYLLQYWPLLLISFGLAILPLTRNGYRRGRQLAAGSGNGEDHGS